MNMANCWGGPLPKNQTFWHGFCTFCGALRHDGRDLYWDFPVPVAPVCCKARCQTFGIVWICVRFWLRCGWCAVSITGHVYVIPRGS